MRKIYVSYDDMEKHILNIVKQLNDDNWRPDYIVGITRGGLLPAVLLSHYLSIPMFTIKVSLRDDASASESADWMAEDAIGYVPYEERLNYDDETRDNLKKNILLVDDINDTGATIAWIKSDWRKAALPGHSGWSKVWGNNVRWAVIVDNLASEQSVDYCSIEVNKADDPSWLVFPVEDWWLAETGRQ